MKPTESIELLLLQYMKQSAHRETCNTVIDIVVKYSVMKKRGYRLSTNLQATERKQLQRRRSSANLSACLSNDLLSGTSILSVSNPSRSCSRHMLVEVAADALLSGDRSTR